MSKREALFSLRLRGLRRFVCALFTCGPRWTVRHLKPFGGLR